MPRTRRIKSGLPSMAIATDSFLEKRERVSLSSEEHPIDPTVAFLHCKFESLDQQTIPYGISSTLNSPRVRDRQYRSIWRSTSAPLDWSNSRPLRRTVDSIQSSRDVPELDNESVSRTADNRHYSEQHHLKAERRRSTLARTRPLPVIILNVVVLPAPLIPSKPKH